MRKLELETRRLRVFLPSLDEANSALAYFSSNKSHLKATDPVLPLKFYILDYWEKRLNQSLDEFDRDESVRLFIETIESPNTFIGSINFTQIARGPFQACYLGYSIDHGFEGKGLMSEALRAGIQYIFQKKHLHRIMANYLPDNQRSANTLHRLGFRIDGSSPDYLYIKGAWRNHILTSLTNREWTPREEDQAMFASQSM